MRHPHIIIIFLLQLFVITVFTTCGDDIPRYLLTIDGYKANFSGYYYIDGSMAGSFEGVLEYTDSNGYNHYYYEIELDDFTSIKVYTFKSDSSCSLSVTLWHEDEEVASVTSGENEYESYDEDTGTYNYVTALDPLYYESADDEEDSDDDDS